MDELIGRRIREVSAGSQNSHPMLVVIFDDNSAIEVSTDSMGVYVLFVDKPGSPLVKLWVNGVEEPLSPSPAGQTGVRDE